MCRTVLEHPPVSRVLSCLFREEIFDRERVAAVPAFLMWLSISLKFLMTPSLLQSRFSLLLLFWSGLLEREREKREGSFIRFPKIRVCVILSDADN